ncbi:C40 family peptidase [Alcaligenaceae bacterium]|nr:C40 family peptidase [Alcaligenaceae bacterium]
MVLLSSLVLAGCATNQASQKQHADSSMLIRAERDLYLAQTQSDPLGAYLANRELSYAKRNTAKSSSALASTALGVLGIKYRYGGETPDTGFDCSGLVTYAAEKSLGLKLPRRSVELARLGTSVKRNELRKGDLVFFNTRGSRFSHVGIYLGNRKFVHAPRTGSVVRIESMDIGYWQKRYNGARRLAINTTQQTATN